MLRRRAARKRGEYHGLVAAVLAIAIAGTAQANQRSVGHIAACARLAEEIAGPGDTEVVERWRKKLVDIRALNPDVTDAYVRAHESVGLDVSFTVLGNATVSQRGFFNNWYARRTARGCGPGLLEIALRRLREPPMLGR